MDSMTSELTSPPTIELDLATRSLREVNSWLHAPARNCEHISVRNPAGKHSIAVGLTAPMTVTVDGHVGYYAAGMNKAADVIVKGNAGVGVAENMMSGSVRIMGNASAAAGATAHGGLLVIEGDAAARCGISMKGADIVVGGDAGHMSAFMAQAGALVIRGDAGEALGDSIYEARLYVRGSVASLGADCVRKDMDPRHHQQLQSLLKAAGYDDDTHDYTRYGSARGLYHFHVDNAGAY